VLALVGKGVRLKNGAVSTGQRSVVLRDLDGQYMAVVKGARRKDKRGLKHIFGSAETDL